MNVLGIRCESYNGNTTNERNKNFFREMRGSRSIDDIRLILNRFVCESNEKEND